MKSLAFYIFGNSSWNGFPQRDIHIAVAIARKGYRVFYINEANSVAKITRDILWNNSKSEAYYKGERINTLKIFDPPTLPTFFRSSLVPRIDKGIISKWFSKKLEPMLNNSSIFYSFNPIWFYFLEQYLNKFNIILYDIFDDARISSRNARALRYSLRSELIAIKNSDFITVSSNELLAYVQNKYKKNGHLIYNGIESNFIKFSELRKNVNPKIIGLIGALTVKPECYDLALIIKIAKAFPNFELRIIGPYTRKHKKLLGKIHNIKLLGPIYNLELRKELHNFDVGIIPFLTKKVVNSINPLKLYEYLSFGKAVIATDNFDYEDAGQHIYLANSHDEFLTKIKLALKEDNIEKNKLRSQYASKKTWDSRVSKLLKLIDE